MAGLTASATLLSSCASGRDDPFTVGVIAPFSGPSSSTGSLVTNGLEASVRHLNAIDRLRGRPLEVLLRDAGADPGAGVQLYEELASQPEIFGILWCGVPGLTQVLPQIRDGLPLIAVFEDQFSEGELLASTPGSSLFQVQMPQVYVLDALAGYAADDRGYTSAALLHDTSFDREGTIRRQFEEAFTRAGIDVVAVEPFAAGGTDYGPQLQRLQTAAPHVLYIDGLPADAADIALALDALGASYVDTPTAKGAQWRPHIFGSARAFGDGTWPDLAGESAKVGTVTGSHLGGLAYLPAFEIGTWMRQLLGKDPLGGEELAADGLASILRGVEAAGTTDREGLIRAMERIDSTAFASVPFGYTPDRHVAYGPEDVVIRTLERLRGPALTSPPYDLGREWTAGNIFAGTAAAFTHLVRPTLEANRQAHPDVMASVLDEAYGTQCTKQADGTLDRACEVH